MAVELSQQFSTNNTSQSNDVMKNSAGHLASDLSSTNVLLHELQLGEQLNESVEQTRRADFSLMLAMLAEDVREQSQFLLPKSEEETAVELSNLALRKQFNLPDKAKLALTTPNEVNQFKLKWSCVRLQLDERTQLIGLGLEHRIVLKCPQDFATAIFC